MAAPPLTHVLVRHGPSPGSTENEEGLLDAVFDGHCVVPLGPDAARLVGTDGADAADPPAFEAFVREVWERASAPPPGGPGAGHILVGACAGFRHHAPPGGCGRAPGALPYAPAGYVPLYAVARATKAGEGYVDLAVDYRGGGEPRPVFFGAGGGPTRPPPQEGPPAPGPGGPCSG